MTYCVAVKLDAGLVFLSDSRTNAGLDQISTFRKMMIYERPGDRFMVMLSAARRPSSFERCRSGRDRRWSASRRGRPGRRRA